MGSYSLKPVQLVSIDTMLRQRLRATKHRGATTVHSSVIGPTLHLLCTAHSTTQQSLAGSVTPSATVARKVYDFYHAGG